MEPLTILAATSVAAHDLRTAVLVVAAVAFIIFRLMRRHPVSRAPLVVVPLVLAYFGLTDLHAERDLALVGLLAGCLVVEFGIGLLLGRSYTMWRESGGEPWATGTKATIGLWVLAFAVRVAFIALAQATDLKVTESAEIELSIAAAFVGQNLVIAHRAGLLPSLRAGPPPAGAERL